MLHASEGLLWVTALLAGAGPAYAQCTVPPGRPVEDLFRSDVVFPQERGEMQLEVLPAFEKDGDGRSMSFGLAGQYGLTRAWQNLELNLAAFLGKIGRAHV